MSIAELSPNIFAMPNNSLCGASRKEPRFVNLNCGVAPGVQGIKGEAAVNNIRTVKGVEQTFLVLFNVSCPKGGHGLITSPVTSCPGFKR